MPKHYRAPGKKKEGDASRYITRTKAVHYLQVKLSVFRKLCIFKGVFPRVPKKKTEGNDKTYYHIKDIAFLAHEPLLDRLREIRVYEKKIRKAEAMKNSDLAARLRKRMPTYSLDKIIRERYPTFEHALRDLDECLTMVHLFAELPANETEHIKVDRIHNCQRLSHAWQAYISRTHSLRKTFISVKGIYYQAEVQGQKITWLTPHSLQQVLPNDVDFNVILTFLELYEAILSFVNFKLYQSMNVMYPPILDPRLEALGSELYALYNYIDASTVKNTNGTLMGLMETSISSEDEDDVTKECKNLFKDLKFFLSREVPRECLLFIIPAFGGVPSWEGDDSPFEEEDVRITHQIVDRPTLPHKIFSREYIQPQWIFDCVNARIILPTDGYLVGRVPPPHLSPFVDNKAEGYVPEYAETISRLQAAAKGQVLPLPGFDDQEINSSQNLLADVIHQEEENEIAEKRRKLMMIENQYHSELKMELQQIADSATSSKNSIQSSVEDLVEEDAYAIAKQAAEDDNRLSTTSMSRNKRKLYEAMKISNKRKEDKINILKKRREENTKNA